ncbi:MAG: reductive dehalogenase [Alphaproteobacteria bacterium]|nr:reductive dehalogenase [Alphaproteobacteria bacterium]
MRDDWAARFGESDAALGIETTRDFQPFNQINDIFTRAFWDPKVKSDHTEGFFDSYRVAPAARRGQGFAQKDFALRNASWIISDLISDRGVEMGMREGFQALIQSDTPVAKQKVEIEDISAQSREIKRIARLFGADLVGITEIDERWHYASRVDTSDLTSVPNELPKGISHVIVMGHSMDFDLVETYPSALAGASTGREYSHEAAICIQLAAYIRGLGYEAVASMNDTALVIPYAIKAGLGEYGRNQMVLTPEFGPRVRFSKIFTSLPLRADQPMPLGLNAYCHSCTVCADACPPKALPKGAPEIGSDSPSTITGVKKWSANCEKCFGYWAKIKTDCAICMRVCPFNRQYDRWQDRLWRWLAMGRGRVWAQRWMARQGTRARMKPAEWWSK